MVKAPNKGISGASNKIQKSDTKSDGATEDLSGSTASNKFTRKSRKTSAKSLQDDSSPAPASSNSVEDPAAPAASLAGPREDNESGGGGYEMGYFTELTGKKGYLCYRCLKKIKSGEICSKGHNFCAACLKIWQEKCKSRGVEPYCYVCAKGRPSPAALRTVQCPCLSCTWAGAWRDLASHLLSSACTGSQDPPPLIFPSNPLLPVGKKTQYIQ